MDYFTLVAILRSAGIPARASARDESHPLVIAGGPAVSANPEPVAPFLDAILIGEIEPIAQPLTNALHHIAEDPEQGMDALAAIPGVYLPHRQAADPPSIARQWLPNLDACPTHSAILTPRTEFPNMGLIEIARGCGRACRFCLAGYGYRPPRERSVETILKQARSLLAHTERLGLVSAAVSDHTEIDRLAPALRDLGARISVSSMRVDPISLPLLEALAESGTRTLTIAPEAGSARLRQTINKTQTEEDVLRAVESAAEYGLRQIKLYYMIGLPTEAEADIAALVALSLACAERFPGQVTANITPFVPKAHTPFQRVAQAPAGVVQRRIETIKGQLFPRGVAVKAESPALAEIQGTLSRGDRRVADALLAVARPAPGRWKRALASAGVSSEALLGARGEDEDLPWNFIESGVRASYLAREARRADTPRITPPCPPADCTACGVCG
jgi:radical SAM superfamily enzyme YgiQ (UPF0313 family)